MKPRSRYAEVILHAEEMGRVAGEVIAEKISTVPIPVAPYIPPVTPPAVPPEEEWKEFVWEETLDTNTRDREIKFNMDAKAFNIRTDREIQAKFFRNYITIPSSESPFSVVFPLSISRVYITALSGAAVKLIASTHPIQVSFGRAKLEGSASPSLSSVQSYWYWASQISQPALTYTTWTVTGPTGAAYTVPDNKRLVIDLVTLSTDVKGTVQQVELLEYTSGGTTYRFGGAFFDCVVPLRLRVPLSAGSQVLLRTYNWDIEDRTIWAVINGFEEYV